MTSNFFSLLLCTKYELTINFSLKLWQLIANEAVDTEVWISGKDDSDWAAHRGVLRHYRRVVGLTPPWGRVVHVRQLNLHLEKTNERELALSYHYFTHWDLNHLHYQFILG